LTLRTGDPYNRDVVMLTAIALAALLAVPAPGAASDVRAAVGAFVARASSVSLNTLVIEQDLALYHPDGRRQQLGKHSYRVTLVVDRPALGVYVDALR